MKDKDLRYKKPADPFVQAQIDTLSNPVHLLGNIPISKTNILVHGIKLRTLEKLTAQAAAEELSRNRFINKILDEFVSYER
jgi:hypothetical protein